MRKIRLYTSGAWDLFHYGHVRHLKNVKNICLNENEEGIVVVGMLSDETIEKYKRKPIMNYDERREVLEACKFVDEIIDNAPLKKDLQFLEHHRIDFVCYGFPDPLPKDLKRHYEKMNLLEQYDELKNKNMLIMTPYQHSVSTTEIIKRIGN